MSNAARSSSDKSPSSCKSCANSIFLETMEIAYAWSQFREFLVPRGIVKTAPIAYPLPFPEYPLNNLFFSISSSRADPPLNKFMVVGVPSWLTQRVPSGKSTSNRGPIGCWKDNPVRSLKGRLSNGEIVSCAFAEYVDNRTALTQLIAKKRSLKLVLLDFP